MTSPGWLTRSLADVPAGDGWLGPRELAVLAGFRFEKRRSDWRLGRFTAKVAVGAWLGAPADRVEIVAAPDGAPEAHLDGRPAGISLSLSHRAGRALALVADPNTALGCDLEVIERRSQAFVLAWLAPAEQRLVAQVGHGRRDLTINLMWTAKEAAAKASREGLRLDPLHAVTQADGPYAEAATWRRLAVEWSDGRGRLAGWWRAEPGWVMAVAGQPAPGPPRVLDG